MEWFVVIWPCGYTISNAELGTAAVGVRARWLDQGASTFPLFYILR